MDKSAKEVAKREDSVEKTKARAILVSNQIKAALLRFLQGFSKQNYPQQFFYG